MTSEARCFPLRHRGPNKPRDRHGQQAGEREGREGERESGEEEGEKKLGSAPWSVLADLR